ncbi:UNVERIFIED_CONTAM: hypothetical protein FKN15_070364 [Acipenser sinensis]
MGIQSPRGSCPHLHQQRKNASCPHLYQQRKNACCPYFHQQRKILPPEPVPEGEEQSLPSPVPEGEVPPLSPERETTVKGCLHVTAQGCLPHFAQGCLPRFAQGCLLCFTQGCLPRLVQGGLLILIAWGRLLLRITCGATSYRRAQTHNGLLPFSGIGGGRAAVVQRTTAVPEGKRGRSLAEGEALLSPVPEGETLGCPVAEGEALLPSQEPKRGGAAAISRAKGGGDCCCLQSQRGEVQLLSQEPKGGEAAAISNFGGATAMPTVPHAAKGSTANVSRTSEGSGVHTSRRSSIAIASTGATPFRGSPSGEKGLGDIKGVKQTPPYKSPG